MRPHKTIGTSCFSVTTSYFCTAELIDRLDAGGMVGIFATHTDATYFARLAIVARL